MHFPAEGAHLYWVFDHCSKHPWPFGTVAHRIEPKGTEKIEFLFAMEEMIATMLVATPSKRANLGDLLKRLDSYKITCRQFRQQKFVILCITSGRNTKVNKADISDISTDDELFEVIKPQVIASYRRPNLFGFSWLPGRSSVTDVRFIKFALSNGVFGVLDGPNSMPPASLVRAKEYDCQPSPPTEVPIPRDVFIHLLSKPHIHTPVGSLSERFWLDRIPKRLDVISYRRHAAETIKMQSSTVGWGIEIVEDAGAIWLLLEWTCFAFLWLSIAFIMSWNIRVNDVIDDIQNVFGIISIILFIQTLAISDWAANQT
jgi:hypothetical protein